jgi:uncharacterized protein (TIGR00297 family)
VTPAALGLALAPAIAFIGFAAHWLTFDGALAASIIGAAVFAGSGLPGAAMLVLFFVSGSVLSALKGRGRKTVPAEGEGQRNARQVIANGFWAATGSLLVPSAPVLGWAVITGALAAAQSDTWATEVGTRAGGSPRLITTWARVPPGTSGAVSAVGTLAGIGGAVILAGAGAIAGVPLRPATAGVLGGMVGLMADSFVGATAQARFRCDACNEVTERRRHTCGQAARAVRGWRWLDNDAVNLIATGAGGAVAALLCFVRIG